MKMMPPDVISHENQLQHLSEPSIFMLDVFRTADHAGQIFIPHRLAARPCFDRCNSRCSEPAPRSATVASKKRYNIDDFYHQLRDVDINLVESSCRPVCAYNHNILCLSIRACWKAPVFEAAALTFVFVFLVYFCYMYVQDSVCVGAL